MRVARALGLSEEIAVAALAKKFEEVYRPGLARPGPPPAGLRGPLPAAAGPRRGAPLRHHLPPRAPGQAHDHERPRRGPRPRPGPQGPAARRVRRRPGACGRLARGAAGPGVAARRRWPRPCTTGCTDAARPARRARPGRMGSRPRSGPAIGRTGRTMSEYLVVTGMSGAGRSTAAAALEDLGLVRHRQHAAGAPQRGGRAGGPARARSPSGWPSCVGPGRRGRVDEALPAIDDAAGPGPPGPGRSSSTPPTTCWCGGSRAPGAATPRGARGGRVHHRRAAAARAGARAGPTSSSTPASSTSTSCAQRILELFGDERGDRRMRTSVVSFGYKHGMPARRRPRLRLPLPAQPLLGRGAAAAVSGLDAPVRDYVLGQPETAGRSSTRSTTC